MKSFSHVVPLNKLCPVSICPYYFAELQERILYIFILANQKSCCDRLGVLLMGLCS